MAPRSAVRVRRHGQSESSRPTVRLDTRSLFRPATRRVTFEVVSTSSSRRHAHRASENQSLESPVVATASVNAASGRPTCQIRDIPRRNNGERSGHHYADGSQQSLGSLLERRTHRNQPVWTRKRRDHKILSSYNGFWSPKTQCLICGLLFVAVLSTYLTLSLNIQLPTSLHVTLILLLLLCTILFFHGLLRTWMINRRLRLHDSRSYHLSHSRRRHRRRRVAAYNEPLSPFDMLPSDDSLYTPTTPVRVHLFRDEEALIDEKNASITQDMYLDSPDIDEGAGETALPTPPPPAYGLWRCSVRADPNLLHWARCGGDDSVNELDAEGVNRAESITNEARGHSVVNLPKYIDMEEGLHLDPDAVEMSQGEHSWPASQSADASAVQNHDAAVVIPEDDWPLRNTNGAVQEVTRMLLEEQRRHSIL